MTEKAPGVARWVAPFLAALAQEGVVVRAARAADVAAPTVYYHRKRRPEFAEAFETALRQAGRKALPCEDSQEPATELPSLPATAGWRARFLEALAETSNVTASAARAGIPARTVYKYRRQDPAFAARWRAALAEGYENLEMELLCYLRNPAERPKMDVANAIRLMAMHRQEVARQRAVEDDRSEQEVLDSIDAMIDQMRQRSAANAALLAADAADEDR